MCWHIWIDETKKWANVTLYRLFYCTKICSVEWNENNDKKCRNESKKVRKFKMTKCLVKTLKPIEHHRVDGKSFCNEYPNLYIGKFNPTLAWFISF